MSIIGVLGSFLMATALRSGASAEESCTDAFLMVKESWPSVCASTRGRGPSCSTLDNCRGEMEPISTSGWRFGPGGGGGGGGDDASVVRYSVVVDFFVVDGSEVAV